MEKPFEKKTTSKKYERLAGVYKIKNSVNGKIYIGQTNDFHKRWLGHIRQTVESNSKSELYEDMKKYGFDKFEFSILEIVNDKNKRKEAEIRWIEQEKSVEPNGYNKTKGGDKGISRISEKDLSEIVEMLKNGSTAKTIMKKFGISIQTVTDINVGRYHYDPNIDYPIKKRKKRSFHCRLCGAEMKSDPTLSKSGMCRKCYLKSTGRRVIDEEFVSQIKSKFAICGNKTEIAKEYNVSSSAVGKWLKK